MMNKRQQRLKLVRSLPAVTAALVLSGVMGCSEADQGAPASSSGPENSAAPGVVYLAPLEQLNRVSVALRGERPSAEERQRVERDPAALNALVDEYLASPGFGTLVKDIYNDALHLRVPGAIYPAGFPAVGDLAGEDVQRINTSITEAPLRLIEKIALEDRPFTEIVTADYTIADGVVAKVWGLPYSGDGREWQTVRYTDGRPAAGILSDGWLYTRYSSTFSNKNRGRANAIARALLCHDFIDRHVEVDTDIDLGDEAQVQNAIATNPSCVSCHQTLDPLASHFGDFFALFVPAFLQGYPFESYAPEQRFLFTVKPPGYFGYPGGTVRDLGQMIALDPRFSLCTAARVYAYLHQLPLNQVPQNRARELGEALRQSGTLRSLVRSVVTSDDFRVSHVTESQGESVDGGMFKVRPWQLAKLTEQATGFRWEANLAFDLGYGNIGRIDLLGDSLFGYETLAGGTDSVNVTLPSYVSNASSALVVEGLARAAAEQVVSSDFAFPNSTKLLGPLSRGSTDELEVRPQIAEIMGRVFGVAFDQASEDVEQSYQLFAEALKLSNDPERAWKTLIYALLQDPRFLFF